MGRDRPRGRRRPTGSPAAQLTIDVPNGDIYTGNNTGPTNFILQNAPGGRLDAGDQGRRQPAERAVPAGRPAGVRRRRQLPEARLHRRQRGRAAGGAADRVPQRDRRRGAEPAAAGRPTSPAAVWHLRLARAGDVYTASYSADGVDVDLVRAVDQRGRRVPTPKVGLFSLGAAQTASKPVSFDYFRLDDGRAPTDTTAPVTTADRGRHRRPRAGTPARRRSR